MFLGPDNIRDGNRPDSYRERLAKQHEWARGWVLGQHFEGGADTAFGNGIALGL